MVNSIWSSSSAALSSILMGQYASGRRNFSIIKALNGALVGMVDARRVLFKLSHFLQVCICSSAASVRPWAALIIGAIGGVLYRLTSRLLSRLKIDSPVDAIPVHFTGGLWGVLAQPIFNYNSGIIYSFVCIGVFQDKRLRLPISPDLTHIDDAESAIVGIFRLELAWSNRYYGMDGSDLQPRVRTHACTLGTYTSHLSVNAHHPLQRFGMLRIAAAVERAGLDLHVHQEAAYDHSAAGHAAEGIELGQVASTSSISTMVSALMPSEDTDESNF